MPLPSTDPGRQLPELPPGFELGVSSTAYQVEGAVEEDGRGPSVWDVFTAKPGSVRDSSTGAVAADHYHRRSEDVALLARLGVDAYRFSVSWPRIQPHGRGLLNAAGCSFYDRLVDELLEAGIKPVVTLHAWDLPQTLQEDGGWLNPGTVEAFAQYAARLGDLLGDRVAHWIPIDEPNVLAFMGYATGRHAPGFALGFDALHASHHLLLGHGRAVVALRESGVRSIGCANNHAPMWPVSDDEADVGATKLVDALWNAMFLEPMLLGRYPADLVPLLEPIVEDGDLAVIRQPLDFYGVSYYAPHKIGATSEEAEVPFEECELLGYPRTASGLAVVPDALREWLITFRARYRAALPPLVITGYGASTLAGPEVSREEALADGERVEHLDAPLQAVATACRRGVDVRGFFARSFLDGFEWAAGHTHAYGLVHVDPRTGARTPKDSFSWFASVIAAQTASRG